MPKRWKQIKQKKRGRKNRRKSSDPHHRERKRPKQIPEQKTTWTAWWNSGKRRTRV